MGRPKGSKNKPKGIPAKEPPAAVKAKKAKSLEEAVAFVASTAKPAYEPKTPVTLEHKKALAQKVKDDGLELCAHYGLAKWPEDVMEKRIHGILDAVDLETTQAAFLKAKDRIQMHLWAMWADGKISGPVTQQNVDRKAKQAESLAKYLESIGQDENARKQWDRAEKIRTSLVDSEE